MKLGHLSFTASLPFPVCFSFIPSLLSDPLNPPPCPAPHPFLPLFPLLLQGRMLVPQAVLSNRGPLLTHALSLIDDWRLEQSGPHGNFSINLVFTWCQICMYCIDMREIWHEPKVPQEFYKVSVEWCIALFVIHTRAALASTGAHVESVRGLLNIHQKNRRRQMEEKIKRDEPRERDTAAMPEQLSGLGV